MEVLLEKAVSTVRWVREQARVVSITGVFVLLALGLYSLLAPVQHSWETASLSSRIVSYFSTSLSPGAANTRQIFHLKQLSHHPGTSSRHWKAKVLQTHNSAAAWQKPQWPGSSPVKASSEAGFSVMTLATSPGPELHMMLASSPYPVEIVGKNATYEKYRSKVMLLLKALMKREENEVILFVDAFDVMFVPCGRDLLEEWKAMDADLVFQADDFSWPDVDDNVKNALFPDPPRDAHPSFRFMCAGAWMGTVGAVRYFISAYFLRTGLVDNLQKKPFDDQRWWRDIYLSQVYGTKRQLESEPVIKIDYHGYLFQMFRPWTTYLRVHNFTPGVGKTDRVICKEIYHDVPACILHAEGPDSGWKDKFWDVLVTRYAATNNTVLFRPGM